MKARYILMVLVLVLSLVMAACSKAEPAAAPAADAFIEGDAAWPRGGGLQGTNALALGTLRLEGTEHAVTPEQAAEMLPLWKLIRGGSLQGAAETEAVLKQIEAQFDEGQLAAIEEMELTLQEIGSWMEERGVEMPTRGAGQGGGGVFQNITAEQRDQFRQEMQNMSPEQRATRLADMGIERPSGGGEGGGPGGRPGGFGGRGGGNVLLEPLIELLSKRAAE